MKSTSLFITTFFVIALLFTNNNISAQAKSTNHYEALIQLFKDWRQFENPPLLNGAPDYTMASFNRRQPAFIKLQHQLNAIDTTGWPIKNKVDWRIVWAEMNGYDFNRRILKPWQRDPAFYKSLWTSRSDVPAHEGPTMHGITDSWKYSFPLSTGDKAKLIASLKVIPSINKQAKIAIQ